MTQEAERFPSGPPAPLGLPLEVKRLPVPPDFAEDLSW